MRLALVVDDEPGVAEVVAFALDDAGFAVCPAANGREALAALSEMATPPDVIITDCMMPVMDGPAMIAAIHANGPCRVPIILMSAIDPPEHLLRGTAAFLRKPFRIADLLAIVSRLIASGGR